MLKSLTSVQFTPDQTPGYDVVVAFAALSTLSLAFVGLHILTRWIHSMFNGSSKWDRSKERIMSSSEMGRYIICLLLACFFTSLSGIISGEYVRAGGIEIPGAACTAQSILAQMGFFSTAYFSVIVAIHTLLTLVFRCHQSRRFGWTVIALGWAATAVFAVSPLNAFGFEGFICGINTAKRGMQFFFHLLPVYFALVLSVIGCILLHFNLRGSVIFNAGKKSQNDPKLQWSYDIVHDDYYGFVNKLAPRILFFFVAYILTVIPYVITKTLDLAGVSQAFALRVLSDACVYLLGFFNVIILYMIYRMLGPISDEKASLKIIDLEKSGATAQPKKVLEHRKSLVDVMRHAASFPKRKISQPASRTKKLAEAIKSKQGSRVRNLTQTHERSDSQASNMRLIPAPSMEAGYDLDAKIIPAEEIPRFVEAALMPPERALQRTKEFSKMPTHRANMDPPRLDPAPQVINLDAPPRAARPGGLASANDTMRPSKGHACRPLPSRPNEGRLGRAGPESAGAELAGPQSARVGRTRYSPAIPRPSSDEEIISFSARPLPSAPVMPGRGCLGEPDDSRPAVSRSAKHTGSILRGPRLSIIDASSDSETEYPSVPALVLPAHKRRDGLPSRGPFLKRVDDISKMVVRTDQFESDIGSSSGWGKLVNVSLATPRTAIPGLSRRKMEPTSHSATPSRRFPQLRTPVTTQVPQMVIQGSPKGTALSATHYF